MKPAILKTIGSLLFVWFVAAAFSGSFVSNNHFLLLEPKDDALKRAAAEISYFQFLIATTVTILLGLAAGVRWSGNMPKKVRRRLDVSTMFAALAVVIVVLGYAIRNLWQLGEFAIPRSIVAIDLYFNGPLTAILYILAVGTCVLAFLSQLRLSPR